MINETISTTALCKKPPTVGVFDSGRGGLSVVKQINRAFAGKALNVVYIGDTMFFPYSGKSIAEISQCSARIIRYLKRTENADLVNIACNSATSALAPHFTDIETSLGINLVGMIELGAERALHTTRNNCIGIMGTRTTISSCAYQYEIARLARLYGRNIEVVAEACPKLAPQVEKYDLVSDETKELVHSYLRRFINRVDTLILGCTHYPFVQGLIQEIVGPEVKLVDPAEPVARHIADTIERQGNFQPGIIKHKILFTSIDGMGNLIHLNRLAHIELPNIQIVDIPVVGWDEILTNWSQWAGTVKE